MKKLTVTQCLNSEYWGPERTPEQSKYEYQVVQVVNSTTPQIHAVLSKDELDIYCASTDWTVTIK